MDYSHNKQQEINEPAIVDHHQTKKYKLALSSMLILSRVRWHFQQDI